LKDPVREIYKKAGYSYALDPDEQAGKLGLDRIARLASNENPWPPSGDVLAAGREKLLSSNRYPAIGGARLVSALKDFHGDYTFVTSGYGMDGIIDTIMRMCISKGDRTVISTPTFSMYRISSEAYGGVPVFVGRRSEDFSVEVDAFVSACSDAKLAFICSPNNPTGNSTPVGDIREILESIDCLLFLDCAYSDFSDIDYRPLMKEFDNLVIGKTMSKAFALAGMRVGYAFVPDWCEEPFKNAEIPFNMNPVSEAMSVAALADRVPLEKIRSHVKAWRERYMLEVPFHVYPSESNFVLIDVAPYRGDDMAAILVDKGVIVRSCTSFSGLGDHYIRVNVGEDWECERFIKAIKSI
jgi:histidinol-phosphate aminotransferase